MATHFKYHTQKQFLKKLHITNLKGLQDVTIDFVDDNGHPQWITGIFGMNGCGKTTVLQTILCLYRPKERVDGVEDNTKMSRFFKSVNGNNWLGSSYEAEFQHELIRQSNGQTLFVPELKSLSFFKSGGTKGEWKVRQTNKYDRPIFYIPVSTCLPVIETIGQNSTNVTFNVANPQNINQEIVNAASYVTGFQYTLAQSVKTWRKPCLIVQKQINSNPAIQYHSFHMGAGEQRIFRILEKLYKAPDHSLFVIDELDITLHTAALKRLIKCIYQRAKEKKIQIVFSSHRQELMDMKEVNAFYLLHTISGVSCMHNPTSDCYEEMTGEINKPFVLYLEDEVSKQITTQRLNQLNILHRTNIKRCGTYHNCIMLLAAEICKIHEEEIQNNPIDADTRALNKISDYIAVLDGDVDANDIETEINRLITGVDANSRLRRQWVKQQILQYNSTPSIVQIGKNMNPEEYIHNVFKGLPMPHSSIVTASNSVEILGTDTHEYFTPLLEDNKFSLESIIAEFTRTPQWATYLAPLDIWAQSRKAAYHY